MSVDISILTATSEGEGLVACLVHYNFLEHDYSLNIMLLRCMASFVWC